MTPLSVILWLPSIFQTHYWGIVLPNPGPPQGLNFVHIFGVLTLSQGNFPLHTILEIKFEFKWEPTLKPSYRSFVR